MAFNKKGDHGAGFKLSNLNRKTVMSLHPSGNISKASRCPPLLSATTSAASFNDLSSLFKEDLREKESGPKSPNKACFPSSSPPQTFIEIDYHCQIHPNPMNKSHNVQKRNKSSQAMKKLGQAAKMKVVCGPKRT